jgi:aminocarboxymuconate-semialdehyde decarboxylase
MRPAQRGPADPERSTAPLYARGGAKVDAWSHILPAPHIARLNKLPAGPHSPSLKAVMSAPELFDLSARFRTMDRFGDYAQILTPVPALHLGLALANPGQASELVQFANDGMADLVVKQPDRFRGFAALLPMHDPGRVLQELDRVVAMGALGVQVETNISGVPLDHEQFEPLFARAAQLGRAIWVHPFRFPAMPDYPAEKTSRYAMSQALGWPYETAVTLSRLVFSGHLDRHPNLKIIGHHGGGMIPHFSGRLGRYLEVWGPKLDTDLAAALPRLKRPLIDYFRMFFVDTALNGAAHGVECVAQFFGADHVLFGTDTPFDPGPGEFIRDTLADIGALNVKEPARRAILAGNAIRLLDLR